MFVIMCDVILKAVAENKREYQIEEYNNLRRFIKVLYNVLIAGYT